MNPFFENQMLQTRRQFFGNQGLRLGSLALGMMMANNKNPTHNKCRFINLSQGCPTTSPLLNPSSISI